MNSRTATLRRADRATGLAALMMLLVALSNGRAAGPAKAEPPADLLPSLSPPREWRDHYGSFRSPLQFDDGRKVQTADDWHRRRAEIVSFWEQLLGPWPPLIDEPRVEYLETTSIEGAVRQKVLLNVGLGEQAAPGYLILPRREGPLPAVLVLYYDAESGVGLGTPGRDFGLQLARRGFATLSVGPPGTGFNEEERSPPRRPYFGPPGQKVTVQPLSALAYTAANCHSVLAGLPHVDEQRIGVMGHSFGGKWAMFASCLHQDFACAVWSDAGIVVDERDRRRQNPGGSVNYWDPWYLGFPLGTPPPKMDRFEFRGRPSEANPRTGSYRRLVESGRDLVALHALMAPRPFLVSGGTADLPERWPALNHTIAVNRLLGYRHRVALTSRASHAPTKESNEQAFRFLQWHLQPGIEAPSQR